MDIYHSIFGYDKNENLNKWKRYLISKLTRREIDIAITNLNVPYDCTISVKIDVKLKDK